MPQKSFFPYPLYPHPGRPQHLSATGITGQSPATRQLLVKNTFRLQSALLVISIK